MQTANLPLVLPVRRHGSCCCAAAIMLPEKQRWFTQLLWVGSEKKAASAAVGVKASREEQRAATLGVARGQRSSRDSRSSREEQETAAREKCRGQFDGQQLSMAAAQRTCSTGACAAAGTAWRTAAGMLTRLLHSSCRHGSERTAMRSERACLPAWRRAQAAQVVRKLQLRVQRPPRPQSLPSLSADRGMLSPFFTSASSCLVMSALLSPSTLTASSTP